MTEYPRERIVSRRVAGNVQRFTGEYRLGNADGGLELHYTGRVVPAFDIPRFLESLVLRAHVQQTFGALVDEIERRQARRAAPEPSPRP